MRCFHSYNIICGGGDAGLVTHCSYQVIKEYASTPWIDPLFKMADPLPPPQKKDI